MKLRGKEGLLKLLYGGGGLAKSLFKLQKCYMMRHMGEGVG